MKILLVFSLSLVLSACVDHNIKIETRKIWGTPRIDSLNPMTSYSIELGEKLFFDKRLSSNNQISCADCHIPQKAFTDGKRVSTGVMNRKSIRNAPSLLNSVFLPYLTWDGGVPTLEMQMLIPLQDSNEMNNHLPTLISKLESDPEIQSLSQKAYGRAFDIYVLTRAIGNFQRSLLSQNSPFDQWYYDQNENAISNSAKKGFELFNNTFHCTSCHALPAFTNNTFQTNKYRSESKDMGRFRISRNPVDQFKFRVPSLRNVAITAPYMHDGGISSLEKVLIHYDSLYHDPIFRQSISPDNKIPSRISLIDRKNLIHFFSTLTDTSYIHRFQ